MEEGEMQVRIAMFHEFALKTLVNINQYMLENRYKCQRFGYIDTQPQLEKSSNITEQYSCQLE